MKKWLQMQHDWEVAELLALLQEMEQRLAVVRALKIILEDIDEPP